MLADLRNTMTNNVGVVRSASGLKQALRDIAKLETANRACQSFVNMTATATLIATAALLREESRGGHFRKDFPKTDNTQAHRSRLTLDQAMTVRAKIIENGP
ncbi:hypothetical protein A9Q96_09340 [Rhodobacterales bacterium 52_120_T64]|nr:hypothetical protein A9Q96_09340 [Rhodobacterales bacterium 52_120_T64]